MSGMGELVDAPGVVRIYLDALVRSQPGLGDLSTDITHIALAEMLLE